MPDKIATLQIHVEQRSGSEHWLAVFVAVWESGAQSAWDVQFPGVAAWSAGDMTDDVWIGAVLRAATDGHQPVERIEASELAPVPYSLTPSGLLLAELFEPDAPLADGSRAESLFAQGEHARADVSRETDA
jgi:hypothetical protein